jgi:hypothetical protein
VGYLKDKLE